MSRRLLLVLLAVTALTLAACSSAAAPQPITEKGAGLTTLDASRNAFAPATGSGTGTDGQGSVAAPADAQLIVRTGSMSLLVKDVPAAVAAARVALEGLGGRIAASQSSGDKDQPAAQVTYRIPAARFDDALAALRALSLRVVTEQTQSVEVTAQVVDLGARLDNLRVTEKALQAIMAQATKIPDVLAVQQQLTEVRGQIEQLTAEKTVLEDQAAQSSLTVDFGVEILASQTQSQAWDAGKIVDRAFSQLIGLGQDLATFVIEALIVGLPVLLGLGFLGLVALGLWRLVRRLRRAAPAA